MKPLSRGFTLIETLIAAGILATGSVAIVSLFVGSIRISVANRERANASVLVADKMEQLRQIPSSSDGFDDVSMPGSSFVYRRAWQITGTDSRVIVVTVSTHNKELARAVTVVNPSW